MKHLRAITLTGLAIIACAAAPALAGDSGRYSKLDRQGIPLPDNAAEWTTVLDNQTQLVWEVKTDDNGLHDKDNVYPYKTLDTEYLTALNQEKFGGFDDWRVPTDVELKSLYQKDNEAPHIDLAFFPNTISGYYWSFYICGDGTFQKDKINFGPKQPKPDEIHFRAVRGGKK